MAPNGTALNPNPDGLAYVRLFPNQGGGYGHGLTREMEYPEGYDRTINMTVKDGRIFSPSFAATMITAFQTRYPTAFAAGWQDSSGVPFAVIAANNELRLLKNNTTTSVTSPTSARFYSCAFHDDGNVTSATPYLYAGTDPTHAEGYLCRMTRDGVWTRDVAGSDGVRAKYVVSTGDAFWGTINDYQIRKCASGDPFVLTNYGSAKWAGTADAKITSLGAIGAAPIVGKENGVVAFNEADQRYDPIVKAPFHPDNFPSMDPDGAGGLYTTAADGRVVHIRQFGQIIAATPLKDKFIGRDTPRGRITSMTVAGDRVYALLDRGARMTQPAGMKVLYSSDGTSAALEDFSDAARDGRFDTVADISGMTTASVLLIGCDSKFAAWEVVMNTVSTATARLSPTVVTSVASGMPAGISPISAYHDGTDTMPGTTSTPFGQTGTMAVKQSVNLSTTGWDLNTILGYSKYWVRLALV